MCGVSGQGKSTLANKLKHQYAADGYSVIICSTDSYFMVDGEYKFDASKLGINHNLNRQTVNYSMGLGINVIIVDNTNLTAKERKPYIDMAKLAGYEVKVVEPTTEWKHNPEVLADKNQHGVPLEAIKRMLARYEPFSKEELN